MAVAWPDDLPTTFGVSLSSAEWDSIRPKAQGENCHRTYAELLATKIHAVNEGCVLVGKGCKVTKSRLRKSNGPYCSIKLACVFSGCTTYNVTLLSEPKTGDEANFTVSQVGSIKHQPGEVHARRLTGVRREQLAQLAIAHGITNTHTVNERLRTDTERQAGNFSGPTNKHVIKQTAYMHRDSHRADRDGFIEFRAAMQTLKNTDTSSKICKGYVQSVGFGPRFAYMWTEAQIRLLHKCVKDKTALLYFDSTGSVVKDDRNPSHRAQYYAAVLKPQTKRDPAIPIFEMLSCSHTEGAISAFLVQFVASYKSVTHSFPAVQKIETDFSWALVSSVILSFNKMSVSAYLQACYDMLQNDGGVVAPGVVLVHLCAAHMIKLVSNELKGCSDDMRKFVLFSFAAMQNSDSLDKLKQVYSAFMLVMLSEKYTKSVRQSFKFLKSEILKESHDAEVEAYMQQTDDSDVELHVDAELDGKKRTIRGQSPFYTQIFKPAYDDVVKLADESSDTNAGDNAFCNRVLAKKLHHRYIHLCPFWTGIMIAPALGMTRDTNSLIENHFRVVKRSVLEGKNKLRDVDFITRTYNYSQSLVQLSCNPGVHQSYKKTNRLASNARLNDGNETALEISLAENTWRRPHSQIGKYYKLPASLPDPEKAKGRKRKVNGEAAYVQSSAGSTLQRCESAAAENPVVPQTPPSLNNTPSNDDAADLSNSSMPMVQIGTPVEVSVSDLPSNTPVTNADDAFLSKSSVLLAEAKDSTRSDSSTRAVDDSFSDGEFTRLFTKEGSIQGTTKLSSETDETSDDKAQKNDDAFETSAEWLKVDQLLRQAKSIRIVEMSPGEYAVVSLLNGQADRCNVYVFQKPSSTDQTVAFAAAEMIASRSKKIHLNRYQLAGTSVGKAAAIKACLVALMLKGGEKPEKFVIPDESEAIDLVRSKLEAEDGKTQRQHALEMLSRARRVVELEVSVHCSCRLPDNGAEAMARCEACKVFFHQSCGDINRRVFKQDTKSLLKWHCAKCCLERDKTYPLMPTNPTSAESFEFHAPTAAQFGSVCVPWDGTTVVNKGQQGLKNTCPLDNFMQILFHFLYGSPTLAIALKAAAASERKLDTLLQMFDLMKAGNFKEAKLLWVSKVLSLPSENGIFDCDGSPFELFSKQFLGAQSVLETTTCNSPHCPKAVNTVVRSTFTPYESFHCNGIRSFVDGVFMHSNSPLFIIADVPANTTMTTTMTLPEVATIAGTKYRLAGIIGGYSHHFQLICFCADDTLLFDALARPFCRSTKDLKKESIDKLKPECSVYIRGD